MAPDTSGGRPSRSLPFLAGRIGRSPRFDPARGRWLHSIQRPLDIHPAGETSRRCRYVSTAIETLAAVIEAPGKDFVVETVQLSAPGPTEVLVRIEASGVCHSDWNAAIWRCRRHRCPRCSATRAAAWSRASARLSPVSSPGDKVVLSWLPTCGICPACMSGDLVFVRQLDDRDGSRRPAERRDPVVDATVRLSTTTRTCPPSLATPSLTSALA